MDSPRARKPARTASARGSMRSHRLRRRRQAAVHGVSRGGVGGVWPAIAVRGRPVPAAMLCGLRSSTALARTGATAALLAGVFLGAAPMRAQDATWLQNPGSGDYNTAANWSPASVPTGTAFFGTSAITALSISAPARNTTVGGWTFNAGASNYTFTVDNSGQVLVFTGAGIVINGGSATITDNFALQFLGSSTAGSAT